MSVDTQDTIIQPNSFVESLSPYIPGKAISELKRELNIASIIKLASNENPLGASLKSCTNVITSEDLARYPDANGFELKQAIAQFHQIQVNQVTLGNGSNDVIDLIFRAYLTCGDEIVISEYAFSVYKVIAQSLGVKVKIVKSLNYGHDLKAMAKAVTEDTKVVFIANPNNPTGTYLTCAEIEHFIQKIPTQVMVVLDEAYREYIEPYYDCANMALWLQKYPNVVFTRTFSKAYGLAGLRVGFGVSNVVIADMLNRVRQPFNVNVAGLIVAAQAIKDQSHIQKSVELNSKQKAYLCSQFEKLNIEYIPSVANFVAFNVNRNAVEIYQALLYKGIIVRPLAEYQLPTFLRVTVGLASQNELFIKSLKEILQLN